MNNEKTPDPKKIKKIAQDLIQKIAPEAQVNVLPVKDSTVFIEAKVDDPQALIGKDTETLLALQHLLRVMIRRTLRSAPDAGGEAGGDCCYVDLDINNYKKKRREYLKELALSAANEVALAKKEQALSPMSAYERRVVHMELSLREDIVTESRGFGPDRKVVIKPAPRR